jgi:3-hydroxyisobutyrate dehydrogenase-like beta-hydroxyacid dehydrogenase
MTENSSSRIAVVGTGAMGTAIAQQLLNERQNVVVWNRTRSRTTPLRQAGASVADTVEETVSSSGLALLTLKDYAGVEVCLDQLKPSLTGHTVVVLCTGSAADARRTADHVSRLGADYLDAGVQASPEMIGTDAGTLLYSGSVEAFRRHQHVFELLSTARFVGMTPEAASVCDLALFGLWYDAQLGLLRGIETVAKAGIDITEFADMATTQIGHVAGSAHATASEMLDRKYPAGPATIAEHMSVLRQLADLRTDSTIGDGGLGSVLERVAALVADGRGREGLTAMIS